MSSIVFVNGSFLPFEEASIPIMDRGFLFADGIYEVSAVLNSRLVDNDAHLARLDRSLDQIRIANPYTAQEWTRLEEELVRRNGLVEGVVYMEVTRGAAERDFAFPKDAKPTVVMFTQVKNITRAPAAETGVAVVTVEDLRWKRRDIKSVALLAQVLAKQAAAEAGVFEAWMVEDGHVTEGSSSTAFIITRDGRIVTRPLSNAILPGITRQSVMRLAQEHGLKVEERLFTIEEAHAAAEAFLTSASSFVMPVVEIDGKPVGNGRPGALTRRLRQLYLEMAGAPAKAA
ncbi:MAG TPA: D-amino-acid transaminase [Beijerinckiaceae bacterium]|jgi:D-alanine transaminase|nr:D-amino-acid transaminase [Beijerinckiaceae bacterium]